MFRQSLYLFKGSELHEHGFAQKKFDKVSLYTAVMLCIVWLLLYAVRDITVYQDLGVQRYVSQNAFDCTGTLGESPAISGI